MSPLYTTKSLGRTWIPSPVRSSTRARYGTWPKDPPNLRWLSAGSQRTQKWSNIHERFALLLLIVVFAVCWCTWSSATFLSPASFYFLTTWNTGMDMTDLGMGDVAYVTYASSKTDLCSAVMQLESLHRLGAEAKKVLLHPKVWNVSADSVAMQLLRKAEEKHGAVLQVVDVNDQHHINVAVLAAGLTEWKRTVILDLDSTILRRLDDEFFGNANRERDRAAAAVVLLSPSTSLFEELKDSRDTQEILAKHSMPLPHILQTSELRREDRSTTRFSAKSAFVEANLVHFSDGPPWKPILGANRDMIVPPCTGKSQCEDYEVWQWLYNDFRFRRKEICGPQFNEWEAVEAQEEANRRIIPLLDRVNGVGGNSGAV